MVSTYDWSLMHEPYRHPERPRTGAAFPFGCESYSPIHDCALRPYHWRFGSSEHNRLFLPALSHVTPGIITGGAFAVVSYHNHSSLLSTTFLSTAMSHPPHPRHACRCLSAFHTAGETPKVFCPVPKARRMPTPKAIGYLIILLRYKKCASRLDCR